MGFFDELKATAKSLVDKAGKKTDEVANIGKLKYQSIQLENELKGLYQQLGVNCYAKMVEEADNGDLIASIADEIKAILDEINEVNDKLTAAKNEKYCPECGAKSDLKAAYCSVCGAKLPEPPAAEEAPAEEECCCEEAPAEECCCAEEAPCCEEAPAEECCCAEEAPCCEEAPAEEPCCPEAAEGTCCCEEKKEETAE